MPELQPVECLSRAWEPLRIKNCTSCVRELRDIKEERDILKKACDHLLNEKLKQFRFMKKYQKQFGIVKMAQVLDASIHGYYRWIRAWDALTRRHGRREMIDAIMIVQQENSYRTDSPRVHKELKKKGHGIGPAARLPAS